MKTITINLKNGVPMARNKEVILCEKHLRLLKCNGKKIQIWAKDLIYKKL